MAELTALLEEGKAGEAAGLKGALVDALLEGVEPVSLPPALLPSLLEQVRATDRMTHFAPQLQQLYDLTHEQALSLIEQIRNSKDWGEGPAPGVKLLPVTPGPKASMKIAAIVFLDTDAEFPSHPHLGNEKVFVLEGAYRDSSGAEFWRGEMQQSDSSSEHSFRAIGGIPCICAGLNATSPEDP